MMNAKIAACLVGLALSVGAEVARAQSADRIEDPFGRRNVTEMAQKLHSVDSAVTEIRDKLVPLCAQKVDGEVDVGAVVETALLAEYHIIPVVRDSVLACRATGEERNAPYEGNPGPLTDAEVVRRVTARILFLKGPTAARLIDAGRLAINDARRKGLASPQSVVASRDPLAEGADAKFDEKVRRMKKLLCISDKCRIQIEKEMVRIRDQYPGDGPLRSEEERKQEQRDAERDLSASTQGKGTVHDADPAGRQEDPPVSRRKAENALAAKSQGKGTSDPASVDRSWPDPVPEDRSWPPDPPLDPGIPLTPVIPIGTTPGGTASLQ